MRIQIHMLQNHSPANLNRDDLGAPKTCYFGGVLRSRISSQCLKRSIRLSPYFAQLLGGLRTRRLAGLVAHELKDNPLAAQRVGPVFVACGLLPKSKAAKGPTQASILDQLDEENEGSEQSSAREEDAARGSKALIYTTRDSVQEIARIISTGVAKQRPDSAMAEEVADVIVQRTSVPDMALCGRMLEPDRSDKAVEAIWKKRQTQVEAALQVAHAISTHEARPEVDYYVAADDVPGEDAGAGFIDEALFASACFYKYFSIDWPQLVHNLRGVGDLAGPLAAHTVGAFLKAAAFTTPTGKQNSYAAHNLPEVILVEGREAPMSYANAFARPVQTDERDLIRRSVDELVHYVGQMDEGYGEPEWRLWFSPGNRWPLRDETGHGRLRCAIEESSLERLIPAVISRLGYAWEEVQQVVVAHGGD